MTSSTTQTGNRSQPNGVLAITASQTSGNASRQTVVKPPAPKLKVIVRRLAPGLTETEFKTFLGPVWNLGAGQVDWMLYKPGKESKDPSKPSRPSRAYLHLTDETHLLALSEAVRQTSFDDAQNTFMNQCLIGPPTVEFAPYGRTPGGRPRVDARSGTIDQDPEFMAFLEGLANPTTIKEINADSILDGSMAKLEKVTTTPLVQYLKEKKANKSKEAAVKAAKKQEAQLAKGKSAKDSSPEESKKRGKESKADKPVEKAAREAVRILNRDAAIKVGAGSSSTSLSDSSATPKLDIGKVPGRQRGAAIAAHIRMLQRDLGLSPAQAHRQVRRDTADAQKAERAAAVEKNATDSKGSASSQPAQASTVPTAPKGNSLQPNSRKTRGKGNANFASTEPEANKAATPSSSAIPNEGPQTPVVLLKKPESAKPSPASPATQSAKTPTAIARKPPPTAVPSEGATQAFVKHANPSQGVTEALLKEAMEKFGIVSMVEIDKRKGFAYVDFADTEGLKNAMAANPISVAQGTVQVMQRKGTALPPEKKPIHQAPHAPARGGRGGRGGTIGRRGGRGAARGTANSTASSDATRAHSSTPSGPATK